MADLRLSNADQVLINAAGVLSCQRLWNRDDSELVLDVVRDVIGRGNPDHPYMAAIVTELRLLIDDRAETDRRMVMAGNQVRAGALLRLSDALARLMKWRLGEALARLQPQPEESASG